MVWDVVNRLEIGSTEACMEMPQHDSVNRKAKAKHISVALSLCL